MADSGSRPPIGPSVADPPSRSNPPSAPPVEAEALVTEEEKCLQILIAFGLEPAAPRNPGVAWKLVTLPFYAIAGGMGVFLGSLRLGAWAIGRVFSFLGLTHGATQPLILGAAGPQGSDGVAYIDDYLNADVVLEIACHLRACRRDVLALRSTCPAFRAAIPNTNGPLLMLSGSPLNHELPGEMSNIVALGLLDSSAGYPSMISIPCISLPPPDSALWGAANGFLALQQRDGTEALSLFCLNCGSFSPLPRLPEGRTACIIRNALTSGGVFFPGPDEPDGRLLYFPYAIFPTVDNKSQSLHMNTLDYAVGLLWEEYPQSDYMRSLVFLEGVVFVGVSDGMVAVARRGWPLENRIVRLAMDIEGAAPFGMLPWGNYGSHVFRCADKLFICTMLRSQAGDVAAAVFALECGPNGYALLHVHDIGSFSVYLGGNQAVVLPAINGAFTQKANTIYIHNDDSLIRTSEVLAINIGSGEVRRIPFPPDVHLEQHGQAFWVVPAVAGRCACGPIC